MYAWLADFLTLLRVAAAGILIWLGISRGATGLSLAALTTFLGWTTDQLDGWAARRSPTPTRLGRHDFAVDLAFYVGILGYLTLARFLPWQMVAGFIAVALLGWSLTRRKAVAVLFIRMVDVTAGVIIFRQRPWVAVLTLAWLAILAWIYRRRLAERVPRWLNEIRALGSGRQGT